MSIGTGGTDAARTLAEFGAEVIKINNPWEEGGGVSLAGTPVVPENL